MSDIPGRPDRSINPQVRYVAFKALKIPRYLLGECGSSVCIVKKKGCFGTGWFLNIMMRSSGEEVYLLIAY